MAEKKNPDYSESAVKLCNPPELAKLTAELQELQRSVKVEESLLADLQQYKDWKETQSMVEAKITEIRTAIDIYGSFQDSAQGRYAVKQRRESITYQPMLVRRLLPENIGNMVIVESVDAKKMDGMIKGGFVTQQQAKDCGEVKETFTYIIK